MWVCNHDISLLLMPSIIIKIKCSPGKGLVSLSETCIQGKQNHNPVTADPHTLTCWVYFMLFHLHTILTPSPVYPPHTPDCSTCLSPFVRCWGPGLVCFLIQCTGTAAPAWAHGMEEVRDEAERERHTHTEIAALRNTSASSRRLMVPSHVPTSSRALRGGSAVQF